MSSPEIHANLGDSTSIGSITIDLRLFAIARQQLGRESLPLRLPDGATIGGLKAQLAREYPELAVVASRSMFAVDSQYRKEDFTLTHGVVVAWIPPVSGG